MTDSSSSTPHLSAFRARFAADHAVGRVRTLSEYAAEHPGHEGEIAECFADLVAELRRGEAKLPETIGPYRVERELGRGAQGVVYLANDPRLNRRVAIKLLSRGQLDPTTRQRLMREARIAGRLEHPQLCPVFDTGVHGDVPYVVMRFVDGQPLTKCAEPAGTTPAGIAATLALVEKLARALHVAHEAGVVHRDVKPGNVMIDRAGEPVLLDFGLAHDDDDDTGSLTHAHERLGTPAYMAPEQIEPTPAGSDRRVDVWALGVLAWERLTGARPFQAPTSTALSHAVMHGQLPSLRRLNPRLSRDVEVLLQTALQRPREQRYRTALDLADDLRRAREGRPILARRPSLASRARMFVARNRAISAMTLCLLLAMALGLWATLRSNQELARALGALQWRADSHALHVLVLNVGNTWRRDQDDLWMVRLNIARFEQLIARRAQHVAQQALIASDDGLARQQLIDHLDGLAAIEQPAGPLTWLRDVERMIVDEPRLTLTEPAALWDATLQAIAAEPRYRGVAAVPQLGLIPLGQDPRSGLQEFALARTGAVPGRDLEGRLELAGDSALVLVLMPTAANDAPSPFLIAKHELTRAQRDRIAVRGRYPYSPEQARLPATQVDYEHVFELLHCNALQLPTEAQWRFAATAGGDGTRAPAGQFGALAEVGRLDANGYGLHDVVGNAAELCRDDDPDIATAGRRAHAHRGGHFGSPAADTDTAGALQGREVSPQVGCRPVRAWRAH